MLIVVHVHTGLLVVGATLSLIFIKKVTFYNEIFGVLVGQPGNVVA